MCLFSSSEHFEFVRFWLSGFTNHGITSCIYKIVSVATAWADVMKFHCYWRWIACCFNEEWFLQKRDSALFWILKLEKYESMHFFMRIAFFSLFQVRFIDVYQTETEMLWEVRHPTGLLVKYSISFEEF